MTSGDSRAATTINPANRFAYGADLGWLDWRSSTNYGVVLGEFVCSGYIYADPSGEKQVQDFETHGRGAAFANPAGAHNAMDYLSSKTIAYLVADMVTHFAAA